MDEKLKLLGISQESINWYNLKYQELNKDIFTLKREYPTTDEEAFETANRGVFINELANFETNQSPDLYQESIP